MAAPPSGEQFEIRHGDQRATIVEVGGGVREYAVGDRPVLDPYPIDAMCDGEHGTPLIPWPNRVADGAYRFDGTDYAVPLTEPEKHNAIHGFLSWRSWQAVEHDTSRVVMGTRLHPLAGYPFTLDIRVTYELGAGGLVVSTTATNIGDQACPYGTRPAPLPFTRNRPDRRLHPRARRHHPHPYRQRASTPNRDGDRRRNRLRLPGRQTPRRPETRHTLHRSGP